MTSPAKSAVSVPRRVPVSLRLVAAESGEPLEAGGYAVVGSPIGSTSYEIESGGVVRLDATVPGPHWLHLVESTRGPHRATFDVAADGTVWIPEFAGNRLARFDPATSEFREVPLPIADALPYVARVDPRSGSIWVSLAGAGALARFDPGTEAFEIVPMPTRDGIVRHLAIDPSNGGLSPG